MVECISTTQRQVFVTLLNGSTGLVLAGLAKQYVGQITPTVRQAIFGNVETLIVFRLGMDNAQLASRELGAFTAEEVLNLGVGEAFVRSGMSADTYNLQSHPKPISIEVDPTPRIRILTRINLSRSVADVEAELGWGSTIAPLPADYDRGMFAEPEDPSEDDLVV